MGIPAAIYDQVEEVILRCVSFHDRTGLTALFEDGRIAGWQDDVPILAGGSRRQLVRGIIAFLARQRDAQGRNGLLCFLDVLHDRTAPGDQCRQALAEVAAQLEGLPADEMAVAAGDVDLYATVPYGMEAGFTGREKELGVLDQWLREDGDHPMMALLALGGTGKSALSWHWCTSLLKVDNAPVQAIFWWNAAEETNVAAFVADALRFFGDSPEAYGQTRGQLQRLLHRWQQVRSLVVVDGAERLLQAYRGLGTIYVGEAAEGEEADARRCADPLAGDFLIWLAQGHGGTKTLLTSRMMPRELEGPGGFRLQGVRQMELTGLDPEEAHALFHSLGVRSTLAEVQTVAGPLGYHPLSLRLLAGYVAHDPENGNNLSAAVNYARTATLKERQAQILEHSFATLPAEAQQLLSRMAAFRGGVTWQVLKGVFAGDGAQTGERPGWVEAFLGRWRSRPPGPSGEAGNFSTSTLREMVGVLEKRGMVQRRGQDGTDYFDLHPIVRHYAYDQLVKPRALHARLADYFEAVPPPRSEDSVTDLLPIIELYHHLIQAGEMSRAYELYDRRLHEVLYCRFGEYVLALQLLSAIPRLANGLPQLANRQDQTWNLLYACLCHERMGQLEEARDAAEKAVRLNRHVNDPVNLASALAPYAMVCAAQGKLREADEAIRESTEIFDRVGSRNWRGISHRSRARVLMLRGQYGDAERELDLAAKAYGNARRYRHGRIVLTLYRAQWHLLTGEPEAALALARQAVAQSAAGDFKQEWVDALRVKARALMAVAGAGGSDRERMMAEAGEDLERALAEARRVNLLELEVHILPEQAAWHLAQGNRTMAASYALEALEILEPTAYRLVKADVNALLAKIAHGEGACEKARAHAADARSLARCDGPPYAYAAGLEAAEKAMAAIAAAGNG